MLMRNANKLLSLFNLKVSPAGQDRHFVPGKARKRYWMEFYSIKRSTGEFVFKSYKDDSGPHPIPYQDFECSFAARYIAPLPSDAAVLDVGSYRQFILGAQTLRKIVTLDIRDREPATGNESVVTGEATMIGFPAGHFDCVVSLSSIEHFGLGRYGDAFDPMADVKAVNEMCRVLKPGGLAVISTTIHKGRPSVAFNAHRIYNYSSIRGMLGGMGAVEEQVFSKGTGRQISYDQMTDSKYLWDIYCGCWRKR
jgi:SAM-dependent methyltransferase